MGWTGIMPYLEPCGLWLHTRLHVEIQLDNLVRLCPSVKKAPKLLSKCRFPILITLNLLGWFPCRSRLFEVLIVFIQRKDLHLTRFLGGCDHLKLLHVFSLDPVFDRIGLDFSSYAILISWAH